jgi:hypothetical protein
MNNRPEEIIKILQDLKNDAESAPSASFRTNARIRILNTVAVPVPSVSPSAGHRRLGMIYAFRFGFVVFLLFGGTVYAAQSSGPKDALYQVKVLSEQAALTLSPTESAKTSVAMTIIGRRAEENEDAKKEGNQEDLLQTITNFESSVSQIRKTDHLNQDKIEREIEDHEGVIREEQHLLPTPTPAQKTQQKEAEHSSEQEEDR